MSADPIYLDYAATAPVLPEVAARMAEVLAMRVGNAASDHRAGRVARDAGGVGDDARGLERKTADHFARRTRAEHDREIVSPRAFERAAEPAADGEDADEHHDDTGEAHDGNERRPGTVAQIGQVQRRDHHHLECPVHHALLSAVATWRRSACMPGHNPASTPSATASAAPVAARAGVT